MTTVWTIETLGAQKTLLEETRQGKTHVTHGLYSHLMYL